MRFFLFVLQVSFISVMTMGQSNDFRSLSYVQLHGGIPTGTGIDSNRYKISKRFSTSISHDIRLSKSDIISASIVYSADEFKLNQALSDPLKIQTKKSSFVSLSASLGKMVFIKNNGFASIKFGYQAGLLLDGRDVRTGTSNSTSSYSLFNYRTSKAVANLDYNHIFNNFFLGANFTYSFDLIGEDLTNNGYQTKMFIGLRIGIYTKKGN